MTKSLQFRRHKNIPPCMYYWYYSPQIHKCWSSWNGSRYNKGEACLLPWHLSLPYSLKWHYKKTVFHYWGDICPFVWRICSRKIITGFWTNYCISLIRPLIRYFIFLILIYISVPFLLPLLEKITGLDSYPYISFET